MTRQLWKGLNEVGVNNTIMRWLCSVPRVENVSTPQETGPRRVALRVQLGPDPRLLSSCRHTAHLCAVALRCMIELYRVRAWGERQFLVLPPCVGALDSLANPTSLNGERDHRPVSLRGRHVSP